MEDGREVNKRRFDLKSKNTGGFNRVAVVDRRVEVDLGAAYSNINLIQRIKFDSKPNKLVKFVLSSQVYKCIDKYCNHAEIIC